jgi:hypothetical protein
VKPPSRSAPGAVGEIIAHLDVPGRFAQ